MFAGLGKWANQAWKSWIMNIQIVWESLIIFRISSKLLWFVEIYKTLQHSSYSSAWSEKYKENMQSVSSSQY
jgi:hypothetical protein